MSHIIRTNCDILLQSFAVESLRIVSVQILVQLIHWLFWLLTVGLGKERGGGGGVLYYILYYVIFYV